jgi:hypothetical protein
MFVTSLVLSIFNRTRMRHSVPAGAKTPVKSPHNQPLALESGPRVRRHPLGMKESGLRCVPPALSFERTDEGISRYGFFSVSPKQCDETAPALSRSSQEVR